MLLACGALHVSGSDCVLLYVVAGGHFRFYIISHFIHGIHTEIMMENQSGGNATKTLSQNNDTENAWWRPKEQRIHAQMKNYSKLQNFGMHWRAPIIQIACGLLTNSEEVLPDNTRIGGCNSHNETLSHTYTYTLPIDAPEYYRGIETCIHCVWPNGGHQRRGLVKCRSPHHRF